MAAYPPRELGPLPVDLVNQVLGTELDPGIVRLSRSAHRHIAEKHPDDYAICVAALPTAVANPSFIGQDPKHSRNFVLVKRVGLPDGRAVLCCAVLCCAGGNRAGDPSGSLPHSD